MNGPYSAAPTSDPNHVFALLADYTDSLDSLPLDLTRSFSDLRELDAVLRTSINAITNKITALTALLQDPSATPASRLFLLREIADAASHLKMGGEDKIRVAGIAAENLAAHQTHIHTVLKTVSLVAPPAAHCTNGSDFDPTTHARRTTFPHIAPALEHISAPSPQKRRRIGEGRPVNGNGAYSANGRAPPKRKPPAPARQMSPAESLRSFSATAGYSGHHAANGFYENGYGHQNGRHHDDDDGTDDDTVATSNNHASSSRSRKPPRRANNNNIPVVANNPNVVINSHEDMNSLMDIVIAHPSDDEEHSFRPHEEPLYCTCKRVSFGEMIGCDNDDCPYEWFHLACVGITKPSPMEKWYCDRCREDAVRKANDSSAYVTNDNTNSNPASNGTKAARGGRGRGKGAGGVKRGRTVK